MPAKKKYNARFAPARIKKIMQSDEEVGKVSAAVPIIISKALEMFLESLLERADNLTKERSARTLTPQHLKQIIHSDGRYDFLKDMVSNVTDLGAEDEDDERKEPVVRKRRRPTVQADTNGQSPSVLLSASHEASQSKAPALTSSAPKLAVPKLTSPVFRKQTKPKPAKVVQATGSSTDPTAAVSPALFPNMPD